MASRLPVASAAKPSVGSARLWLVAVLTFVAGDLATTAIGLSLAGVGETHPIAAHSFEYSVLGAMVALKFVAVAGCYLLWRYAPRPHRVGVPLGLAALGAVVTAWNLSVVARAAF